MSDSDETTLDRVKSWMDAINKTYKGEVVEVGGNFGALSLHRFSSGVIDLDCALGGGWPFGRTMVIAGDESTGKTLKVLKAFEQIENYDHKTRLHRSLVDPEKFEPGKGLFIDLEGAFDIDWAIRNGFNPDSHIVARPEYAEQAVDIVTAAIRENVFDLIAIDSIAQMTPAKEIEQSSEDTLVGAAARLLNRAMRTWTASLNRMSQESSTGGPAIICLNQFRINIGQMFGDPRTLPGGRAQRFAASIIVYTKSAKISDDTDKETAIGEYGGVVHKNKTYIPRLNFAYRMALKETDGWPACQVDNLSRMLKAGKRYGLIVTEKGKTLFGDLKFPTQKALMEQVAKDAELYRLLWLAICEAAAAKRR